jgi:hypothetical protein
VRAVLDTNVLLSGLLSPHGAPAKLLDAWRRGRFDLVTAADPRSGEGNSARYSSGSRGRTQNAHVCV